MLLHSFSLIRPRRPRCPLPRLCSIIYHHPCLAHSWHLWGGEAWIREKKCNNKKYSGLRWVDGHGDRLKIYNAVVTGGSGTKVSFIVKCIWRIYQILVFDSEHQNQNTNKIKYSKYMKHNNPIQTVVQPYFRYLSLNYPINNLSVKLDDVIQGNYIITFVMAVMDTFNLISVGITKNRKKEIMFFIRRIIPKWW